MLLTLALFAGCAYLPPRYTEICNSRSYVSHDLEEYVRTRFPLGSPVRMGVVPFSTSENLTGLSDYRPGLGLTLAQEFRARALGYETIPIIELFNREDWPGKRDEFFKGNFTAIKMARNAGYDLVFVGLIDNPTGTDKARIFTKLIDVEGGVTIWYGLSEVASWRNDINYVESRLRIIKRKPAEIFSNQLYDRAGKCIVKAVFERDKG